MEGALPGLSVRGIGTIGLPLIDAQAKVIIEKSTQARKNSSVLYFLSILTFSLQFIVVCETERRHL